jgi:imidazolonepropionase-like amidohydrolase
MSKERSQEQEACSAAHPSSFIPLPSSLIPALVCATLLLSMSHPAISQTRSVTDRQLVLTGGTIYSDPAAQPITNGVIVIRDGRIVAVGRRGTVQIPKGAETLNCSGLTITAGLWNSHVHYFQRKWASAANLPTSDLSRQLQDMLTRYGFTSVFDLGSQWENTRRIRDRIEAGEAPGPRIYSTGEALLPPGVMPADVVLRVLGTMIYKNYEINTAAQAQAQARKLMDEGADGIKLFPQTPNASLAESLIQAAVHEAHAAGKPAFAHPGDRTGLLAALRSGVDVIAHTTPQSGPWDETILTTMKERRAALIPTLAVWKYNSRHDRISAQEQIVKTAIGQLRAWLSAGGMVLFGTDVGYLDYDPVEEYTLMAEAGLTFRQILAALTTAPAEKFGAANRLGKIAPGFAADLVVLDEDPSRNVRAFAAVRFTIRDGRVIYSAAR